VRGGGRARGGLSDRIIWVLKKVGKWAREIKEGGKGGEGNTIRSEYGENVEELLYRD